MSEEILRRLDFLAPVLARGPDTLAFLQGQLSNDTALLAPGACQIGSLNSPQGRVQAVLTLARPADDVLLLLPREMIASVLAHLRKYVLRSRVTFTDLGGSHCTFTGSTGALQRAGLPVPSQPASCLLHGDHTILHWHETEAETPARHLVIAPAPGFPESGEEATVAWRLAEIRAGLPQVLSQTREAFVAQMLNLDVLGGISFTKGCYTGQEVIARTRYRGAIKRRMFRFAAACPPPPPGTRILTAGVHAGDVVDAARTVQGCELLAVVSLARQDAALESESAAGVALKRLGLPYDVETDGS